MENGKSLSEVNATVDPSRGRSPWRRIAAFFGPAYLVSVGYMDPGNWATDLAGGSQFGYRLIWVLVMSNIMALLLQSLSARLGIVRGKDLAQCNRETYPKAVNISLYVLAELAIAACDLAEVLGMAVGLNLLLGIPILYGVLITLLDTFLLLYLQRLGMRKMEAFIITLIGIIAVCFLVEIILAKPPLAEIAKGLIPSIPNHAALYIAIGIIGATVMPHNLYLHSALVQTRRVGKDEKSIKKALKLNNIDSGIALNLALFVNAAILILAASVFHSRGMNNVARLEDAHVLLHGFLGTKWASHLFAIALIAAGQSSTITGTLAGQIVMEGYLSLRINPWMRRLITRLLAIIPAVLVILIMGDGMVDEMLIFSQVLLSMQLAFAVIPLILFVSDKSTMGNFRIKPLMMVLSWLVALVILVLNMKLVGEAAVDIFSTTPYWWLKLLIIIGLALLITLLLITTILPLARRGRAAKSTSVHPATIAMIDAPAFPFRTIALALDYSRKDAQVIQYALRLASPEAQFILIHIVESATAKITGSDVMDAETKDDTDKLEHYASLLQQKGFDAKAVLGFRNRNRELARIVKDTKADLLILGSHGHRGLKDLFFGETINAVRHMVKVPIFIAQ